MNLMKLSAVSAVLLGSIAASPAVFAHASYVLNGGSTGVITTGTGTGTTGAPGTGVLGNTNLQWINGSPNYGDETSDPSTGANIPIRGFAGIHGATTSNNRVIMTGVYGGTTANAALGTPAVTAAMLGGNFGNYTTYNGQSGAGNSVGQITPGAGNTLLGQLYTFNTSTDLTTKNPGNLAATVNPSTVGSVSVSQGSWNTNVVGTGSAAAAAAASTIYNGTTNTFNTGLLYEQPYAGSGSTYTNNGSGTTTNSNLTPGAAGPIVNGEEYIIQSTGAQFLNVAIAADHTVGTSNFNPANGLNDYSSLSTGTSDISWALYQGSPTGPGLAGLAFLGSGIAGVGNEADFSVALTGSILAGMGQQTGGAFTLVVGDASQSTNSALANYVAASNYDPYVKIGLFEGGTGISTENNTTAAVATPNPNGSYATLYQEQGTPAAVPVPGAVWLFGSAMAGFAGFGRRKAVKA